MISVCRSGLAVVLLAISWLGQAQAAERVDLLLVLAADVSRSVDDPKFRLQRSGYASALENPRVLEAIRSGANRRIAVAYLEWSGVVSQRVGITRAADRLWRYSLAGSTFVSRPRPRA